MEYVQRAVYKQGHNLDYMMHDKVHVSNGSRTLCGKELGDMWFVTGDDSKAKKKVTCKICASLMA